MLMKFESLKLFFSHQITKTPNSTKIKVLNMSYWCPEISGLVTWSFGGIFLSNPKM